LRTSRPISPFSYAGQDAKVIARMDTPGAAKVDLVEGMVELNLEMRISA
jgi:hypothetical protein